MHRFRFILAALLTFLACIGLTVGCGDGTDDQPRGSSDVGFFVSSDVPTPTPEHPDEAEALGSPPTKLLPPITGIGCGPNGRIAARCLSPIAQGQLLERAAAAWNAMNVESRKRFGVTIVPLGSRSSYRTYFAQQQLYIGCRPGWCAVPGTSNHGWGLAVDLANRYFRSIIDRIGAKYGWAKRCSDASFEWWHVKYNPGCTGATWRGRDPGPYGKAAPACRSKRVLVGKSCYPILRKGVRGRFEAVRLVQRILDRHCIPTPNHGKYTQRTRVSVKVFQRRAHVRADGVIGKTTWRKILTHRRHNHTCKR